MYHKVSLKYIFLNVLYMPNIVYSYKDKYAETSERGSEKK